MHRRLTALLAAALFASPAGFAQSPEATAGTPTLEQIMAHPDWLGRQPLRPYWAADSGSFYYERKRAGEEAFDLFQADLRGTILRRVTDAERGEIDVADGDFDLERRRKVYVRRGDVYVRELAASGPRQLTRTADVESDPLFMTDGRIAFRRGTAFYARSLEGVLEEQPFDVRFAKSPEEIEEEERQKGGYLRSQQERLFDIVKEWEREEAAERRREREEQQADPARAPLPFFLGDDRESRQSALSPDGRYLLLSVVPKQREEGRRDSMPRYVTRSGYVEPQEVRVKVGTATPTGESLLLLRGAEHEVVELELSVLPGIEEDPLAELRRAAEKRRQEEQQKEGEPEEGGEQGDRESKKPVKKSEPTRPVRFADLLWSPDGTRAVVQVFSLDNKDRWIAALDPGAGTLRPLQRMHDPAWIGWSFRDIGWLPDGERIYYLSEESGTSQLYVQEVDSGRRLQLTSGWQVVDRPTPSPDGRFLYYTANPEHPGRYEIFRVDIANGASEQVTRLGGRNEGLLSPDGSSLLVTHSTTTRPPELYVQAATPGAQATRATDTISDDFLAVDWQAPEIVEIPSSHVERPIYSRLYAPAGSTGARRAAVVFIHGAGYLQNAHQGWSSYFREFMFHTLLVREGYVVLDMDYRASAGYGRDWRTAIYRRMGYPELEDLEDGVRWLVEQQNVDPERIGVYGGSYGGFLTLMAMFRRPELFAAGAALRPVTDWAHYNHPYTSNILNTPDIDPEAYERSSPIEYAEGLRGPLLICTGMLDDNVFFQDSVRLVQRLIELEKENWEIAIYPVEAHGFEQPESWLDEYRRIFDLFATHLK